MNQFVSGNGHPVQSDEAIAAIALVTLVDMFCYEHEAVVHGGESCQPYRISIVAFIAHKVGVNKADDVGRLIELITEYEEAC